MTKFHIFHKVVNVLVYLFFLSSTVYSVVGPAPDDTPVDDGQTYITPCKSVKHSFWLHEALISFFHEAFWIEYLWTLIHILLGGFVIYQWFEDAHEAALHGVGWHFVISVILSAIWLALIVSLGHLVFASH